MENMTQKKMISVIIPTYNVEDYIKRLTDNLKEQTIGIENLDIIFVDDCSLDTTRKLLYDFKNEYEGNVSIYTSSKHELQGHCRNVGISYAIGDYIAFLDADDTLAPEALELSYNKATEYDADLVIFKWKKEGDRPGPTGVNFFTEIKTPKDRLDFFLKHTNEITRACWDKLYKREFVQRYNLEFSEHVWDEESLFTTPALMLAERIYYLNYILYNYNTKRMDSSAHIMTRNNLDNTLDNAVTWARTYDKLRSLGIIEKNFELFEWWFTVNFLYLSWDFNENRKYSLTPEEIQLLYSYLTDRFPDWNKNKILKERGFVSKIEEIVKNAI